MLQPDEDAMQVATFMTKEVRRMVRGDDSSDGPLVYALALRSWTKKNPGTWAIPGL